MGRAVCFLTALFVGFSLAGCDNLVPLQYQDGRFVNRAGTLAYLPANGTYEPTEQGDAYAYYKKGDITLYTIGRNDPALWLTEQYAGGATTVFYAESIALPALDELDAEKIIVCISDVKTVGICEITDKALIDQTVALFTEGEACEWPLVGSVLLYDLKFYSSDWPQIYMNLIYGEFEEGTFLYERATKRCVEIGGLLDSYIHPENE